MTTGKLLNVQGHTVIYMSGCISSVLSQAQSGVGRMRKETLDEKDPTLSSGSLDSKGKDKYDKSFLVQNREI